MYILYQYWEESVAVFKMKWVILMAALCFAPLGQTFFTELYQSLLYKLNYEICDDGYISPDFEKLRNDFKKKLFGQDIIVEKLLPVLESHFKLEPKKALVISMHGWTGSGKNYATKIVLDSIFKKKSDSEFVHMFNGRLHFPLDIKEYVDKYKINIQEWIRGNITKCPRSVFIFDEIDKMPSGIIDAIKPFLDYHEKIDSVDYRKSIFIFISNIGAEVINSQYMELWRRGKSRRDMRYKDFEPYLRNSLYKTKGGLKESSIIDGYLVNLYLPFLPLEKEQVKKCAEIELVRQGVDLPTDDYVKEILDEMEFNSDRFSTSGCKRVADIVTTIKYKKRYEEL